MPADETERVRARPSRCERAAQDVRLHRSPSFADSVRVGTQVRIALGARRVGGWVVEDHVTPAPGVTLRPIAAVRGWGPPPAVLELAAWAAWRWAGPVPTLLRTASSSLAIRTLGAISSAPRQTEKPDEASHDVSDIAAGLGGGTRVVRVGPAGDPWPLVLAAGAPSARRARERRTGTGSGPARRGRCGAAVAGGGDGGGAAPRWVGPGASRRLRGGRGACRRLRTGAAPGRPPSCSTRTTRRTTRSEPPRGRRGPSWPSGPGATGAPCALVSPCPTLEILALGTLVLGPRTRSVEGGPRSRSSTGAPTIRAPECSPIAWCESSAT